MALDDLIYVDLDKVISLYSQLSGGIVEIRERSTESSQTSDNKRKYDFRVFKHDAGGTANDGNASREVIKPHHAVLKELEEMMIQQGYLFDLNNCNENPSLKDKFFRERLRQTFCVKVKGRAVIEDYERLRGIAQVFPQIAELINKSSESVLKSSPAYLQLESHIKKSKKSLNKVKDRNEKARMRESLRSEEEKFEGLIASLTKVKGVDQWILDGLETWINAFLHGIINLRIYPDTEKPEEQFFGHLKRESFEDVDSTSLHFTYGSFPTEDLTLVGIITSVPKDEGELFNPLQEFEKENLQDRETVERAFRGMFRGFDGFEQMIRTCRYPRILVYPLVVYRSVEPNLPKR